MTFFVSVVFGVISMVIANGCMPGLTEFESSLSFFIGFFFVSTAITNSILESLFWEKFRR